MAGLKRELGKMPKYSDITYPTLPQPRQVRLDSTTKCQAHCLSCHRFLTKRKGEMPIELIKQILDDVSKWHPPLREVVPVNYGELFLREDWYSILYMIAQKLPFTQIVIPTNGSFMTEEVIKLLCSIPTLKLINFSINAYFDETYEKFMGLKAENIPKIRKAVAYFKILRPDILLWASMVFSPLYQTDLERDMFINYWYGVALPQILAPSSAGRPDMKPCYPVKLPCRSIFEDMVIGYDGKISSCCFDADFSLDLGYLENGIMASWHNPELTELRRKHNEQRREEIGLCASCTSA